MVLQPCTSLYSHAANIFGRNHAKSVLQLAQNFFINKKCQNLSSSNSPRDFWHLAKSNFNNFSSSSFPPLLHPDGTSAVYSVSKAEPFAQTFADNSTLDDSGFGFPSLRLSDYIILKSFVIMFIMPSLSLTLGQRMVLMEFLLLFSKTVFLCTPLVWSNFSISDYLLPSILLARTLPHTQPVPQEGDRYNSSN